MPSTTERHRRFRYRRLPRFRQESKSRTLKATNSGLRAMSSGTAAAKWRVRVVFQPTHPL